MLITILCCLNIYFLYINLLSIGKICILLQYVPVQNVVFAFSLEQAPTGPTNPKFFVFY